MSPGNLKEMEYLFETLYKKAFESSNLMKSFINETRHLPTEEIIKSKRYVYLLKNGCFALDYFGSYIYVGGGYLGDAIRAASEITNTFYPLLKDTLYED